MIYDSIQPWPTTLSLFWSYVTETSHRPQNAWASQGKHCAVDDNAHTKTKCESTIFGAYQMSECFTAEKLCDPF